MECPHLCSLLLFLTSLTLLFFLTLWFRSRLGIGWQSDARELGRRMLCWTNARLRVLLLVTSWVYWGCFLSRELFTLASCDNWVNGESPVKYVKRDSPEILQQVVSVWRLSYVDQLLTFSPTSIPLYFYLITFLVMIITYLFSNVFFVLYLLVYEFMYFY